MNIRKNRLAFGLIFILCSLGGKQLRSTPNTVIFDLNGVVIDTWRLGMANEVSIFKCIGYLFTFKNPGNIKKITFDFLDKLSGKQEVPDDEEPVKADGLNMPKLMMDWKTGKITGKEVIAKANEALDSHKYDNDFSNWLEKDLVRNIINSVFNPEILAKYAYPIPAGVEILKECKKNKNLKLMVLSNYGTDPLKALMEKKELKEQIFDNFEPENILISGELGYMKPSKAIFRLLKDKHGLIPENCVLIDDQKGNVDAAKKAGYHAILVENGNFKKVREELVKLGILDK